MIEPDRQAPILPWHMVAGAFLHLVMPFYLLALLVDATLFAPHAVSFAMALARVLQVSPALLGGYAGVASAATLAAALLEPPLRARRARRRAADPRSAIAASRERLRQSVARGKGRFGPAADVALERLSAEPWDHGDPLEQALTRDLAEAVEAAAAALATAASDRRPALAELAARTIAHIAAAHAASMTQKAQQDERQARVVAGYVEARYGASDFSGGGD